MIELFTRVGKRLCNIPVIDHFHTFPGGEWRMDYEPDTFCGNEIAVIRGQVDVNDYIKLNMWARVVAEQGGYAVAYIPYLPAARADKDIYGGAEIYASLINEAFPHLSAVYTTDPHSEKAMSFYRNMEIFGVDDLVREHFKKLNMSYTGVIAPDAGAAKRAERFADAMGVELILATKTRDPKTGRISNFSCPELEDTHGGDYIMIDDLCDGGYTFVGLAEEIRRHNPGIYLDLFVTHGMFTKGLEDLGRQFGRIITTDTWYDRGNYKTMTIPVVEHVITNI